MRPPLPTLAATGTLLAASWAGSGGCSTQGAPPAPVPRRADGEASFQPLDLALDHALAIDGAAVGLTRDDTLFTTSARTVDFNGTALLPRVTWRRAASLFDGSHQVSDPIHRELTVLRTDVRGVVGLRQDFTVGVDVPYVRKQLTFDAPEGGRTTLASRGLGDVSVVGKWRFFQRTEPGGTTEAALLMGAELPTGSTRERDGGRLLPRPLQPGSGATDPIAGLAFTRLWDGGRWLVNADVLGQWNREDDGFDPGDQLRLDVGAQWRLYPIRYESYDQSTLNLLLELNHVRRGRDREDGLSIAASGGSETFLSPGLQWILNDRVLVEAGVQIPVLRDLHGPQLGTDLVLSFGLRWRF